MTADIDDILARLEPKSTATYAAEKLKPQDREGPLPGTLLSGGLVERDLPDVPPTGNPTSFAVHDGLAALMPRVFYVNAAAPSADSLCGAVVMDEFKHIPGQWWAGTLARNLAAHCDFRSVPLPEYTSALEQVRAAQSDWLAVLGLVADAARLDSDDDDDYLLDLTYAESTYTPRRWSTTTSTEVEVDPNGTRAARIYTDADTESWVQ